MSGMILATAGGQMLPVRGSRIPVGVQRICAAVNEGIYVGGGVWWGALAPLPPSERETIRAYVNARVTWNAALPRCDVEGRRIS